MLANGWWMVDAFVVGVALLVLAGIKIRVGGFSLGLGSEWLVEIKLGVVEIGLWDG